MFYFISVFGGDGGNGSSGNDDGGCYISGCSFLFCILCKTILCFKRMDITLWSFKAKEKKICGMEFHSAKAALITFLWILGCNLSLDLKLKNCTRQNWYSVYGVRCILCMFCITNFAKLEKLWRWWFVAKPKIWGKKNFATAIIPSIHVLRRDFIFMHVLFHNLISTK